MHLNQTRKIDFIIPTIETIDGLNFMSLILFDDLPWEDRHDELLRAKVEFYIDTVKRLSIKLCPSIEVVYITEPGSNELQLMGELNDLVEHAGYWFNSYPYSTYLDSPYKLTLGEDGTEPLILH